MLIESEAYVLRTTKYSERDLIVDFFVREHGKISVIARSAKTSKRRFPGGLELFSRMKVRIKSVANPYSSKCSTRNSCFPSNSSSMTS